MSRPISPSRPVEESPGVSTVEALRRLVDQVPFIPDGEIPAAIAEAARLQALLSLALTTRSQDAFRFSFENALRPAPAAAVAAEHEQLVDAPEAARRLNVTEDWIRRHTDELPFTVRLGRKVRFRVAGIDRYLRASELR